MTLNANRITQAAMTELETLGLKPDDVPFKDTGKGVLELIVDAVAKAVIDEIVSNAQVNTTVSVISVAGVTTGVGVSGPGSGTGIGSVS